MKPVSKLMLTSLSLLMAQFAFATQHESDDLTVRNRASQPMQQEAKTSGKKCYNPGYPSNDQCFPPAYNHQGRITAPYHLAFHGSFLWWKAVQEGMEIAISTSAADPTTTILEPDVASQFLIQEFQYKPGFQLGFTVDFDHDDWSLFAEYTRYRHQTTVNNPNVISDGRDENSVLTWNTGPGWNTFQFSSPDISFTVFDNLNLSSQWKLHFDKIDWGLIRPCYQGTHMIVAPFTALRAQWISQSLVFKGIFSDTTQTQIIPTEITASSNSWGIGPLAGFMTKTLLIGGFRLEGDVAGAILWTRYHTGKFHAKQTIASPVNADRGGQYQDYDALRLVNEMNLGMGWGTYFGGFTRYSKFKTHIDVVVTYDFKVFWAQNMMRQMKDLFTSDGSHEFNNLYLHGMTLKSQVNF